MEEGKGGETKPSGSLNGQGHHGSSEEGCWSINSSVVLALDPFAPECGSVLCQVGEDRSLNVHRCDRVVDDDVDGEGVGALDVLNVSTGTTWIATTVVDLTDYVLHAEVGLLDIWLKSLDKLVELIADGVVTDVPEALVETTAEGV